MPAIAGCINFRPKWNGAPGQKLLVIRRNHETRPSLSRPAAQEGPRNKDHKGGRKPINDRRQPADVPRRLSPPLQAVGIAHRVVTWSACRELRER
jgi:hypothetical protein